MFIVFSKEKIKTYLISLATVASLFIMPFIIRDDKTTETSTNAINNNQIKTIQNEIIE